MMYYSFAINCLLLLFSLIGLSRMRIDGWWWFYLVCFVACCVRVCLLLKIHSLDSGPDGDKKCTMLQDSL